MVSLLQKAFLTTLVALILMIHVFALCVRQWSFCYCSLENSPCVIILFQFIIYGTKAIDVWQKLGYTKFVPMITYGNKIVNIRFYWRSKMNDKLVLSVQELASVLGICKPRAYELMNSADFPAIQISPRRKVVPRDALETWLAQQAAHGAKAK